MLNRLFVYGTLLSGCGGSLGDVERQRLAQEARCLGEAFVEGRLYDLGGYPGLRVARPRMSRVFGEIYTLAEPEQTFKWLDHYEGVGGAADAGDEYVRKMVPAQLTSGSQLQVWSYVLVASGGNYLEIPEGRWLQRQ